MLSPPALLLPLAASRDPEQVGGKAANLARLLAAGLRVPDGFVVTAAAFRLARDRGGMPAEMANETLAWYGAMGSPIVAVRSSATAEDLAEASMAGQYRTILAIQGDRQLLEAIEQCWASLPSDRAQAYLAQRGIVAADVAMAVVVQRMVLAEVAGVAFTANPQTGSRDEMLVEASWGLGESVVSGTVQPDTLVVDRATGRVKTATLAGPRACLDSRQLHALWQLAVRVAEHFGSPQDIEWAIHGGEIYLLQSRPITTLGPSEARWQCLEQARFRLRQRKAEGRGDWVRHNLGETLPHPTPLSWSVLRRFMSGDGGFGGMYRLVGFQPSPAASQGGFLELVAGRVYSDLSRGAEMFFADFPYRYDVQLLRTHPDAAQGPPTVPAGSLLQQYRVSRRLAAIHRTMTAWAADGERRFGVEFVPALVQYVAAEKQRDLARLDCREWRAVWAQRERTVLDEFGPQSLLPSLIAAMAMERLRAFLEEHFWDEDSLATAGLLAAAAEPDQTLRANQALYELACGQGTVDGWLAAWGHRGPEEFDLASPRWRERRDGVVRMAEQLKQGPSPMAMHQRRQAEAAARLEPLGARLSPSRRRVLEGHVRLARRYMPLREDGKHYLMLGYDLLRDLACEAGRRLGIGDDVFLLSMEELQESLATGFAPLELIRTRRVERTAEAQLVLPHLITEAEIERLGEPEPAPAGEQMPAFALSGGRGAGPARIVGSPEERRELGQGYVLVCSSTDPSWTPLFVGAAGLVLECGGTLSHGAVVAREMGIPAVVLPGATRAFQDGEPLAVDGDRGLVVRRNQAAPPDHAPAPAAEDPHDERLPRDLLPPAVGDGERRAARARNLLLVAWGAVLAAVMVLPESWLYQPAIRALDRVLWPAVAAWGKPAAVALSAATLAAVTMIGQWALADNRRLRVAKQRARQLRALARRLPRASPRRAAMLGAAAPVPRRLAGAALVPLAVLLGPMVLSFLWFPARVDPASWNARAGATVHVVASVEGEHIGPVVLQCGGELMLDESTPASQKLPPIRATLEARLEQWQKPGDLSSLPWEVQQAGQWVGNALRDDLREYLQRGIPPQTLAWTIATPEAQPGRFPVVLVADGATLEVPLVLGDAYPPEPQEDLGDGKGPVQVVRPADASPIQWVKVTYVEEKKHGQDVFWAPLARFGRPDWDAGWLLTYLAAYLPAMFLLRWLLRVP